MQTTELIPLLEVIPNLLWPIVAIITVFALGKRIHSLRVGENEVILNAELRMAAADKEFQEAEVNILLDQARLRGQSDKEVAQTILYISKTRGIKIDQEVSAILARILGD